MPQLDIFGDDGPMVTDVRFPPQAADANRSITFKCWAHCKLCLPEPHVQRGVPPARRIYRTCTRGVKCLPDTKACAWIEYVDGAAPEKPVKPSTPEWADY